MLALLGGSALRTKPWARWPEHGEPERAAVLRAIDSGSWGGYPAPNTECRRFGAEFARYVGTRHAVLAANGTVTLKVILRALGIGAGDEVIVPALTWIATAGAAAYVNAVPVFADVDPETLCIDPASVEVMITPKTRAVIAVHLASSMADVDALRALCAKHGLAFIEDCAHAHGMRWNGAAAGSFGDAGSFSFQSSKLLTAGEGGAITTNRDELAERCQSLVNCGRKEPGYDSYDGVMFGWNDRITEVQAALLGAQLARLDEQHARRLANVTYFGERLAALGPELGLRFQGRDARVTSPAFYQLVLLYDAARWKGLSRDRFVLALEAEGVPADGAFYTPIADRTGEIFPLVAREYPMIRERYGDRLTSEAARCPVASTAAYERTVWLHHSLFLGTKADVDDLVAAIVKIRENVDALL
ncbi:DegT/DnrJ/EryC1/StrS family aminotransferase [Myxococcota bacterium]|nr:DegT/DnrJ/EryC1/StrS family aminotransferase [Myxococcota bacterium]